MTSNTAENFQKLPRKAKVKNLFKSERDLRNARRNRHVTQ